VGPIVQRFTGNEEFFVPKKEIGDGEMLISFLGPRPEKTVGIFTMFSSERPALIRSFLVHFNTLDVARRPTVGFFGLFGLLDLFGKERRNLSS